MKSCPLKYRTEKGKIEFPNGDLYDGEIVYGMKHGFGKLTETNKLIYTGKFLFDKKEGKGRIENSNCKCRFVGKFKDDKKNGFGRRIFCNGEIIDGEYENDELSFGEIYFINGNKYVGEVLNLKPHGKGEMFIRKTGKTKKGNWEHGKRIKKHSFPKRVDLYDPEEDVMNSFRNGNSDKFGY